MNSFFDRSSLDGLSFCEAKENIRNLSNSSTPVYIRQSPSLPLEGSIKSIKRNSRLQLSTFALLASVGIRFTISLGGERGRGAQVENKKILLRRVGTRCIYDASAGRWEANKYIVKYLHFLQFNSRIRNESKREREHNRDRLVLVKMFSTSFHDSIWLLPKNTHFRKARCSHTYPPYQSFDCFVRAVKHKRLKLKS